MEFTKAELDAAITATKDALNKACLVHEDEIAPTPGYISGYHAGVTALAYEIALMRADQRRQ